MFRYLFVKSNIVMLFIILCIGVSGCANMQRQGDENERILEDKKLIVAGNHYVAMVTEDGNVLTAFATGWEQQEIESTQWSGAVRMADNANFLLAISEKGVLLVPASEKAEELQQKMDELAENSENVGTSLSLACSNAEKVEQWSALYQIYGDYPYSGALGLFEDGTIQEAGLLDNGLSAEDLEEIQSWENIRELALMYAGEQVAGLNSAGEVKTIHMDGLTWNHVAAIETGKTMLFGLTEEGTVLHSEPGVQREYATEAMKDIVFIAAGYDDTENTDVVYGIRSDGKVVDHLGNELAGFEDMVEIAV